MAKTTSTSKRKGTAVKSPTEAPQKPLDISTARFSDGAEPAPRSVYDIVGVKEGNYRERDMSSYQRSLAAMTLIELHDHCYQKSVLASPFRDETVKRLERAFMERNRGGGGPMQPEPEVIHDQAIHDQALKILSIGR